MKTSRKIFKYILLSIMLLFIPALSFVACGNNNNDNAEPQTVKVNYHYEYNVVQETYYQETYKLQPNTTQEITEFYKAPAAAGYTLVGYTLQYGGLGDTISSLTIEGIDNETKEYHLYAKWKKAEYQIEYHLNGGENNPENKTNVEGLFTLKRPTREGYHFVQWCTDEELKYSIVQVGSTEDNVTIKVYAKWEKLNKISYVSNIDNLPVEGDAYTTEYYKGQKYISAKISNIQYFKGYLFTGWTCSDSNAVEKESNYPDQRIFDLQDCTGDIVFTANFIKQNESGCTYQYTYESVQIDEMTSTMYPKIIVTVDAGVSEVVVGDVTKDNNISSKVQYIKVIYSGENPPKLIYNEDAVPQENITFERSI